MMIAFSNSHQHTTSSRQAGKQANEQEDSSKLPLATAKQKTNKIDKWNNISSSVYP